MISSRISLSTLSVAIAATLSGGAVAESSTLVFEEVLVTAEKRSESLQDLSQAITVLDGDDLDTQQISSFVDLSAIAPGVNIAKNEGFKTVITIRGVGNEANQNAIANPSVSYHLDGIYVASPFALQTDFLDLERIEVLREGQFEGRQTFREFMMRRFDPAMRTVQALDARLQDLIARAIRTGDLLRTRVDVERQGQSQELLTSMNLRADVQLQLQKTVEGLSVVAISYYATGLALYVLAPVAAMFDLPKGILTACVVPVVVGLVYLALRRIRRHIPR